MKRTKAADSPRTSLSVERLEPRLLLTAINPGVFAELFDGDDLYFIQGESADDPSDLSLQEMDGEWIVIASYEGPGSVQFTDSEGGTTLDFGDKIGDILFFDTTSESHLAIRKGRFVEGFSLDSVPGPLEDRPDTVEEAFEITVPTGLSGDTTVEYNSGRQIISASGDDETPLVDYYTFAAQEFEIITVSSIAAAIQVTIGVQSETDGPIDWGIVSGGASEVSFSIFDHNGNDSGPDDLNIFLKVVPVGAPYSMVVDRTEIDSAPFNSTGTEDFPDVPDSADEMDLTFDAEFQTGYGVRTPKVTFTGEGPGDSGHDWFTFTIPSGATIFADSFDNVTSLLLTDITETSVSPGLDLVLDGSFTNSGDSALKVYMKVVNTADWSFATYMEARPLNEMVVLDVNGAGLYQWFTASRTPWMGNFGGTDVFAPAGSGGAVVTGNVTFNAASTGFGMFHLDGQLKGRFGLDGSTLDAGETVEEIRVGYIANPQTDFQGTTFGGVFLDGNVERLLVATSVADSGTAPASAPGQDLAEPARITIGGYLLEFQSAGTVYAETSIGMGLGALPDVSPVFDLDFDLWGGGVIAGSSPAEVRYPDLPPTFDPPAGWLYGDFSDRESFSTSIAAGFVNDTETSAYVVGSPNGDFTIHGHVNPFASLATSFSDRDDVQDWYVFNAGRGQEVTVELLSGSNAAPVFVFGPSGRAVAVVGTDEPATFAADEGGNYLIMVGSLGLFGDPFRIAPLRSSVEYEISVTGTMPVALGGLVVGSSLFGAPVGADIEFGDDINNTNFDAHSIGFIDVRGNYVAVSLTTTGHVGYLAGDRMASNDGDYAEFDIGGNLDRLEARTGDLQFNIINVDGTLGELSVLDGSLGDTVFLGLRQIDVGQGAGSVVVGGDFLSDMDVFDVGVDLFYVGGSFGMNVLPAALNCATGADVQFAFVGGDIYDQGTLVPPVFIGEGETVQHIDDGGGRIAISAVSTVRSFNPGLPGPILAEPAFASYRFVPVGRTSGGAVGSAIVSITANDGLDIEALTGRVDIGVVTFQHRSLGIASGALSVSPFLRVKPGDDPFAEVDVFEVNADPAAPTFLSQIRNETRHGDIMRITIPVLGQTYARGSIGVTDQLVGGGMLLNPTAVLPQQRELFAWPGGEAPYVRYDPTIGWATGAGSSLDFTNPRRVHDNRYVHFSPLLSSVVVGDSLGDVDVLGNVVVNADGAVGGPAFTLRGIAYGAGVFDGVAGVVSGLPARIDVGMGFSGGQGGTPAGGVMTAGTIGRFVANNATISGPVFAAGGIDRMLLNNTMLDQAIVSSSPDFSDAAFWDTINWPGSGALGLLRITGWNGGINESIIQVGEIGRIILGPGTDGIVDSNIWASGDSLTERGIGQIIIRSGGLDNTGAPPFGNRSETIFSPQNIGTIKVQGLVARSGVLIGNPVIANASIRGIKHIDKVIAAGDIVVDQTGSGTEQITAILGMKMLKADNIMTGPGDELHIGAAELQRLIVRSDLAADVVVDGRIIRLVIGGSLDGDLIFNGPHSHLEHAVIRQGATGDIIAGGWIGVLRILGGDAAGDIGAGASRPGTNTAIGALIVPHGELDGEVFTFISVPTLRAGGGIGKIIVKDDIDGNITATSYFDVVRGVPTVADIGLIKVVGGDLNGDVTIQRNDPGDPQDPGGDLLKLIILNGDLNGDVTIAGDIGLLKVINGVITGTITTTASDVERIIVVGPGAGMSAIAAPIDIAGSLGLLKVTNGDVDATVTVDDYTGRVIIVGDVNADMTFGEGDPGDGLGLYRLKGDQDAELSVLGDVGRILLIGGQVTSNGDALDPRIEVAGGLGLLRATGYNGGGAAIDDEVNVDGRLDRFILRSADMSGALEAGSIGTAMFMGPGGVTAPVSSNGNLDALRTSSGGINAPVDVFHYAGRIISAGDVSADVTVGSGFPGSGLDRLVVRGDLNDGDVLLNGFGNEIIVRGNMTDSTIDATTLGRVRIGGALTSATSDEIHAAMGSFGLIVSGTFYDVDGSDFFFDFGAVHAYVG